MEGKRQGAGGEQGKGTGRVRGGNESKRVTDGRGMQGY